MTRGDAPLCGDRFPRCRRSLPAVRGSSRRRAAPPRGELVGTAREFHRCPLLAHRLHTLLAPADRTPAASCSVNRPPPHRAGRLRPRPPLTCLIPHAPDRVARRSRRPANPPATATRHARPLALHHPHQELHTHGHRTSQWAFDVDSCWVFRQALPCSSPTCTA